MRNFNSGYKSQAGAMATISLFNQREAVGKLHSDRTSSVRVLPTDNNTASVGRLDCPGEAYTKSFQGRCQQALRVKPSVVTISKVRLKKAKA